MPMPRKSLADHKLQGTTPEYATTPDLAPGRPKYPKGISPDAKRTFKRLCSMLAERRSLTRGDEECLRLYCVLFDRHAKALQHIALEGEVCAYTRLSNQGKPVQCEKPNLWLRVAQDSEKQMAGLLRDLGLTPMTRSKTKPTRAPEQPKPADPMEALIERPTASEPTLDSDIADLDLDALVN
jgi:P27 family predicted phage terminase small subunit